MKTACTQILTINGGSSSIKFALFEIGATLSRIMEGSIERIGMADAKFQVKRAHPANSFTHRLSVPDWAKAVDFLMNWFVRGDAGMSLVAVGHRVVHGGPTYSAPQLLTPGVIEELRHLAPFDPDHLPQEILLVEAFHREFPVLPQIACFDTAFHAAMPRVAQILPVPRRYGMQGVRRYGFHGLSYAYLMQELERLTGAAEACGRVVLAHLGSGASLAAVHGRLCMDTTMAFTPASGLMMGTRCGDIDPGLPAFLERSQKMTAAQFDRMANFESGLLGVSETSSDMQDLLNLETEDDRAAEAVALFCYQAKKGIGAYAAALGGLDTLIFAGGIGEKAAPIRARICDGLGFLGVELDAARNATNADLISADTGQVAVRVIRTDEELMIARSTRDVLGLGAASAPAMDRTN
jgi:acetate kinase